MHNMSSKAFYMQVAVVSRVAYDSCLITVIYLKSTLVVSPPFRLSTRLHIFAKTLHNPLNTFVNEAIFRIYIFVQSLL